MRIAYVVPGDFSGNAARKAQLQEREAQLQRWAFGGTHVAALDVQNGVSSIESAYEELVAAPGGVDRIRSAEAEGFDGAIIGCFGDPGLEAARELVSIPVVGPGEASLLLAAQLGHRIGILSLFDSLASMHRGQAFRAGVLDKLRSIRAVDLSVHALASAPPSVFEALVRVGKAAVSDDGAEVLILGCMSLAFLQNWSRELTNVLGVPVINPAETALKAAETLVATGLSHSKKAYPLPPKLRQAGAVDAAREPLHIPAQGQTR